MDLVMALISTIIGFSIAEVLKRTILRKYYYKKPENELTEAFRQWNKSSKKKR